MHIHIATAGHSVEPVIKAYNAIPGIDKVYILIGEAFEESARVLEDFFQRAMVRTEVQRVSGFDFQSIVDAIYAIHEAEHGKGVEFSINITGGTNLMAAAACSCAYFVGARICYVLRDDAKSMSEQVVWIPTPRTPDLHRIKGKTLEILRFILEETEAGREITNDMIISRFDLDKQNSSYHLNILKQQGLIEVKRGVVLGDRVDNRRNSIRLTSQGRLVASWMLGDRVRGASGSSVVSFHPLDKVHIDGIIIRLQGRVITMREADDRYVEKIAYAFITKYCSRCGASPSGVLFNKYMTLVYRDIRDILGEDIRLPHCWYRWGDEVVRYEMPYVHWNHESGGSTSVSYVGSFDRLPQSDRLMAFAGKKADDFIAMHRGREGMESAVDEVYSGAPFAFQNDYRKLRENLAIAKHSNPVSNHIYLVRQLFEEAMGSFPYAEFPGMEGMIAEFRSVFCRALDRGLSAERLQDISECFWFMFCYRLRIHPGCHENVSGETLEVWRKAVPESEEDYLFEMERFAQFLKDEDEADPVMIELLESGERRFSEIEELLNAMHIDGE